MKKQIIISKLNDVSYTIMEIASGNVLLGDVQPSLMLASDKLDEAIEWILEYKKSEETAAKK